MSFSAPCHVETAIEPWSNFPPMSGSVSKDCPCYSWSHPMFTECHVPQPPPENKMVAGSHWVTPLAIPKCGCRSETLGQNLATQCTRTVNGDWRVSALLALEIIECILSIMGPIQNYGRYFFKKSATRVLPESRQVYPGTPAKLFLRKVCDAQNKG